MTDNFSVADALDERLGALPAVPAEHYLAAGRSAQRKRRLRRRGGAIGFAVAGVLLASQTLSLGSGPEEAREHPADTSVSDTAIAPPSLSSLRVEAGVGSIDSYSTDDIPSWAKEYGHHGPASIAPDGRLWVAPDAEVVRSIADVTGGATGAPPAYALEVRWHPSGGTSGKGRLEWWAGYQEKGVPGALGSLDEPGRWTSDFALWAEDEAASWGSLTGQAEFDDRLVRFEGDRSKVLVPLPGVEIVRQRTDVDTGDMQQYARRSAAEVIIDGQTYFVLANGPRVGGHPFYEPYQRGRAVPDFAGFLDFVASGSDSLVSSR